MKAILIAIASLIAIIFALLVGPYVMPTTKFQNEILNGIGNIVEGHISLDSFRFRVLPYPSFTIRGLTVTSKQVPFVGLPIIKADYLEGSLSPFAMLRGRIVTDVVMKGAELDLRTAAGAKNIKFPFLMKDDAGKSPKDRLRSLRIDDGVFHWEGENGDIWTLKDLKLEVADIELRERLKAKARLIGYLPKVGPKIDINGRFSLDYRRQVFEIGQAALFFEGSRFNIEAAFQYGLTPISYDIHVTTAAVTVSTLSQLVPLLAGGLPLGITVDGPLVLDGSLKGNAKDMAVNLHADATLSRIKWPHLFLKEINRPLKVVFSGRYQPLAIVVEGVTFLWGGNSFKWTGVVSKETGYPAQLRLEPTVFKPQEVLPLFPFLKIVEDMDRSTLELEVKGPLLDEKSPEIAGRLSAEKAIILGQPLTKMSTDFHYTDNSLVLSTLRGTWFEGALFGNGLVRAGEVPAYKFELVVNDVDTTKLLTLSPLLSGAGTLVLKGKTEGQDIERLSENLNAEGTLIIKQGEIKPFKLGLGILTSSLLDLIIPYVPQGLNEPVLEELKAVGGQISDLKASFELQKKILLIPKLEWSGPQYQAGLKAYINPQDVIAGEGDINLSKNTTLSLIRDYKSRREVTGGSGQLDIPITISGALTNVIIKTDETRLAGNLKGETTPSTFKLPVFASEIPAISGPAIGEAAPLAPIAIPKTATPKVEPKAVAPETAAIPALEAPPAALPAPAVVPQEKVEEKKVEVKKEVAPLKKPGPAKKKVARQPAPRPAPSKTKSKMKGEADEDVFKVLVGD